MAEPVDTSAKSTEEVSSSRESLTEETENDTTELNIDSAEIIPEGELLSDEELKYSDEEMEGEDSGPESVEEEDGGPESAEEDGGSDGVKEEDGGPDGVEEKDDGSEGVEDIEQNDEEFTPSELEIRLQQAKMRRCDAAVLSRPLGYRPELQLSVPQEGLSFDIGAQIEEFEVEKGLAAERKIPLVSKTNTLWPTNDEFTKDKAEKRIEDYITRCWSLDPNWLFHIEFVQMSCTVSKRKYIYEVKFSIPTSQFPVPSATASVFFTLEVGYYEGLKESVKVYYVVEGTRYQHVPGALPFQQKWLRGVIVEKTKLQRFIDF